MFKYVKININVSTVWRFPLNLIQYYLSKFLDLQHKAYNTFSLIKYGC